MKTVSTNIVTIYTLQEKVVPLQSREYVDISKMQAFPFSGNTPTFIERQQWPIQKYVVRGQERFVAFDPAVKELLDIHQDKIDWLETDLKFRTRMYERVNAELTELRSKSVWTHIKEWVAGCLRR